MEKRIAVRLDTAEAKQLADLEAIFADLDFAAACFRRLTELIDKHADDLVQKQAYWTSAAISYARCFNAGKRFGLTEDLINQFSDDTPRVHRYLMALRSKHIAHSVSAFEQPFVGVTIPQERPKNFIADTIVSGSIRFDSIGSEGAVRMAALAEQVKAALHKRLETERQAVLVSVQQMPLERIYALPILALEIQGHEQAANPRLT